jgi:hypothetical protein
MSKLDYNPIYKVNYLVNDSVDTIFIFYGKKNEGENQEELFKKIFTENDINDIHSKKINIQFSEQKIHYDDSISTIKIKIFNELKKHISLDEIYLFCQKEETLSAVSLYQSLTQNKKLELTRVRLEQFISNIVTNINGKKLNSPPQKDVYTFDDILEMKIEGKTYIINKVLGQKFFIVENEYPFVCNPYDVTNYDTFFEKNARKSLSTLNSHLLLNSGNIINNNIYLCLANDVLEFVSKKEISQENTIKIYYPFLYNKNITSLEDLQSNNEKLIDSTKQIITNKTVDLFKTIDMFYDVYNLRKSELKYVNKGIKYIKAIIKPEFDINIPLEVIFKIIHATEKNPLIKYNPSSRQENIYRIYTDKISTDGRKIPYLKKANIFKLMKTIAKSKSVSVYIEIIKDENTQTLICEFDENGYITVSSEFESIVSENEIDMIFRDSINPIIDEIKNLLQQSGYNLKLFNSLYDNNVEIKQITYVSQIKISKPINLETYKGCISSVFNNESTEFKSGIHLRFKRVSNFSKVNSQEAFILEKSQEGYRGTDIIEALLENYPDDLNRNQAEELVRKVANEIQVERGVRKTDIKIKNNPGFKTTIILEQKMGIITITVENINDIHYLQTIPVYLDTIIRLTQNKNSTNYSVKEIDRLCSTGEKEEVLVEDIISSTEKSIDDGEEDPILEENDEIVDYKKYKPVVNEKPKGAFSLFFDEEDEDEDDEENKEIGGAQNTSSEESVKTDEGSLAIKSPNNLESFGVDSSESEENKIVSIKKNSSEFESPPLNETSQVDSIKETLIPNPIKDGLSEVVKQPLNESSSVSSPEVIKEDVIPKTIIENKPDKASIEETSLGTEEKEVQEEDEEEEDEEEEEERDEEEDNVRNIDGMKLNKPYYFQSLIENKDPVLILKEDSAEYNAYSRTCSSDTRRQPVILTDAQLEKINKEHKGFLRDEDVIKYGSDKDKQFNYICPRYWCLKTNTIVDPNELKPVMENGKQVIGKDGKPELQHPKCGKVIPRNDKEVKPGYYIYEFYQPEHKKLDKHEKSFKKHDTDNDGLIDFDEFKKILKELKEDYSEKSWSEHYLKLYGVKPNALQVQEFIEKQDKNMRKMFDYEDKNKDNKINFDEFIIATTPKKYPGLIPDKHPKGICLPCCFDKYNTEGRFIANQKCDDENKKGLVDVSKNVREEKEDGISNENIEEVIQKSKSIENKKIEKNVQEQDDYIKGPDKFPLTPGRWGYLPVGIQKMLHEVNADCQISKTNTNIKPNHPCLLRHGIEVNKKQSFIACISDILYFNKIYKDESSTEKKFKKILSIKEMREKIINSITIDTFVTYQNGNLVTDFHNMSNKESIDVEKYKSNSKIFSKLNNDNENELYYMKKVVSAFENFKLFLHDDDAIIDHTYLWDIISMPNKNLFPKGANIIIFQIPNDDITNNVQLICPTNHYSKEFYNSDKSTIIMMKEDNYYEPIYSYTIREKLDIITIFEEGGSKISPTMKRVLNEIIKPFFNTICRPLDSMPNVYKAKRSIPLFKLINELEKIKYKLEKLVVNFNNKVIGVIAEEPKTKRSGFIPCYPSSIPENEEVNNIIFMNDLSIWKSYNTTVLFLNNLVKKSGLRREQSVIPCKPIFKIVEDEWVVGILTETNQFIQLSKPVTVLDADDDFKLPSIKNNNYIVNKNINKDTNPLIQIDIPVSTNNDIDEERVEYIEKTKMETNFYNIFRNTIRILLNDYENVKIRERIEKELSREYIIYSEKLQIIDELLKTLVNNVIQFTGNETYYKLLTQLSSCIVKNKEECESTPNLCTFTKKNGRCNLILPKKNLITNNDNKPIYFKRMADELIRYSRINTFMLQPQTYLSFGNIGYNLNDNEIIMIQSLLTQEYFETLVPAVINKYTKYNSYDEAEPSLTQMYENTVSSLEDSCDVPKINNHIISGIWKKCFPNNFKEIEYSKKKSCTFQFIIDLIEKHTGIKLSVNKIKNELYNEYKQYLDKYHDKIVDILIIEGKNLLGKEYQEKVKLGKIDFLTFITSEKYYFLTTLDLWLLVQKYKIPTIFISQSCILQTNYEKSAFLGYGDEEDNFAFIILPGFSDKNIPNYKIVQSDKGEVFIPLRDINCIEKINVIIQDKISIEEYLEDFTKNSKTIYHKKTKCKELEEMPQNKKESRKIIIENDEIIREQPESNKVQTIIEEKMLKKGTKKKKESNERKGTRKRCPNGEKKNKDGICVKK